MTEPERRWGKPASGTSALVAIAILALVGVVLWLLSERNARQWSLVHEDGVLAVKKGILFPVGRQAFKTDDPALAQAYAPLKPPPGAKLDEERTFDDRAGLDQALYELLARWTRDDVATENPERVERALQWLGRADRLAGLSQAQREDLRALRAEAGFFEGRQLLERSGEALREARERLRLTAGSPSSHAPAAEETVRRLDPLVEALYGALRAMSPSAAPAPAAPAPPADPASPAPAAPPAAGRPGSRAP
jgi:hypothetical protein